MSQEHPAKNLGQLHVLDSCPDCGRRCYTSRKVAKRAARYLYPNRALRAYRCDGGRWWHFGATPDWVRRGEAPNRPPTRQEQQR
ncbi:hypothetical protein [Streptomyces sp. DH37]|uniref:hypothetical protein n=1 Tax=Streptomyces sp. DH37 TaxID=3040122 RepID=UPI002442D485|nr:hypothetical protein [Streptomyces sp. DH37]MDG9703738.1 hypothetical protein [Streptomyces sp. DH37]